MRVGYRPLQHAVVSGAQEAAEALVARWRVPVDVPAADGATALHIAAYTGHLRIVCCALPLHYFFSPKILSPNTYSLSAQYEYRLLSVEANAYRFSVNHVVLSCLLTATPLTTIGVKHCE